MGPAIGAAIGVLFSVGMSVAVSLYVIGFCETLVEQIGVITNDPINGWWFCAFYYGHIVTFLTKKNIQKKK